MSYITEFPDYDDELYIPAGYVDNSWHNNVCPHVEKRIKCGEKEISYLLWQEYKNPINRENELSKRYIFQIEVDGDVVFDYRTNKLKKVKRVMEGGCL